MTCAICQHQTRRNYYKPVFMGTGRADILCWYCFLAWYECGLVQEREIRLESIRSRNNVWLGFSAEDQATFDQRRKVFAARPGERIPWAYAVKLWCSLEPLLGPIDLGQLFPLCWVVCGGESGPHARPCDLAWIRSIKEQCQAAGVPVFVKQLGAKWYDTAARVGIRGSVAVSIEDRSWLWVTQKDRKGGDMTDSEFPLDLRVREFPR